MYLNLKLKPIQNNIDQNIDEDYIISIMEKCYNECAFSTLPYMYNLNSEQAIETYNSGDCVALSLYIKKKLLEDNFISYLIPATIPNKYKQDG